VVKSDGGWSVGRTEYVIDGAPRVLNAWHQDQVVEVPPSAEVIGRSDFCENAAMLYDDIFLTIQPHPEYGDDFIQSLITHRGEGVVPAPLLDTARAQMGLPSDRQAFGQRMADFFRKART
ncbi:MAG: type 1 glutamine amidotransferase, partial [Pseudomonadota bacterium]